MRARRCGRRRRCRSEATTTGCGSRSRGSGASSSRCGRPGPAHAGARRASMPAAGARRAASRSRRCRAQTSPRGRSSCARSRPRAAAGRFRVRGRATARPTTPRKCRCSSSSRSAASCPIVSMPTAASRCLRARADAGEQARGERREERRLAAGPHRGQAARLAPVGCDLGDDLRRRDAERAREPRPRADDGANRLRDRPRVVERRRDLFQIEVPLVDPGLLDRRDDLAHGRPHFARVLAVERVTRPHERRGRAAPTRLCARHRRVDAEAPCDVVRRRDDAAAVRVAADDEGDGAQLRILELLDGGEECIKVEVRDDHESEGREAGGGRVDVRPSRRWGSRKAILASNGKEATWRGTRSPSSRRSARK